MRVSFPFVICCSMLFVRSHVGAFSSRRIIDGEVRRRLPIAIPPSRIRASTTPRPPLLPVLQSGMPSALTSSRLYSVEPSKEWTQLGLFTELMDALSSFEKPTEVQHMVIPHLLQRQSLAFLAATGSGKTLAYVLPLLQALKSQEMFQDYERRPQRPRLLILAPTRELVVQIHSVVKSLCHHIKLSSVALLGGEDTGKQRKRLSGYTDIVVSTPGRLIKHWTAQSVFLGEITHVVVDEMDTMIEQGFEKDLQRILYPVLYRKQPHQQVSSEDYTDASPRLILTSATLTQSIQKMVGDTSSLVNAKKHFKSSTRLVLPQLRVLQAPGLHKALPRLKQTFINVGPDDKLSLLVDQAMQTESSEGLTMIFCNTAASCRAVQFALQEAGISSLACHGELNSAMRMDQLQRFRQAGLDPSIPEPRILVCTDLVARGLDVPQVDHIIMFDFPLNSLDYLHRSGRTARGSNAGRVTALVTKRDQVLATAIEAAVQRGDALDGLSSRKTDYLPGGRLHSNSKGKKTASSSRSTRFSIKSKVNNNDKSKAKGRLTSKGRSGSNIFR